MVISNRPGTQLFDYDKTKPDSYFAGAREDWIQTLPKAPEKAFLELGCGFGGTGAYALAQGVCGHYVGIEIAPAAAHAANEKISKVIVGNVETLELDLEPASYDALLMSEVLEHLTDPWGTLDRLLTYIKPGGHVFASSPNVAHKAILRQLIRGRWDLRESGAMDRTHLRWFTPATFREMFEAAGVEVIHIGALDSRRSLKERIFSGLTLGRYDHLLAYQINFIGRKAR